MSVCVQWAVWRNMTKEQRTCKKNIQFLLVPSILCCRSYYNYMRGWMTLLLGVLKMDWRLVIEKKVLQFYNRQIPNYSPLLNKNLKSLEMSHSRATKWVLWGLKITKDFSWAHRIGNITKRLLVVCWLGPVYSRQFNSGY